MELTLKNTKNKIILLVAIIASTISIISLTQLIKSALAATTADLRPSADGTYLQWSPNITSTTHYNLVNDPVCNATYNFTYTNTTNSRDSYIISLTSTPDNSGISSITITPCASKNLSSAGTSTMKVFYRYNGVNSADGGNYLLSTGTFPVLLTSTNFIGLSLLKTATSTLEVGAILTSGSSTGARLSQIIVNITYSTSTAAPTVTTTGAVSTTQIKTTLRGSAKPNGRPTTGWFRYSTTTPGICNDTFGTRVPANGGISLGSGTNFVPYSNSAASLTPNTTYYYCAIASNVWGKGYGLVIPFTTLP